jgi:nucleosome binding factor SPN SPT16 subunit
MKHGFVSKMENILDSDDVITHEKLSNEVDDIITNPEKINIKISADAVDSCYTPIVQSGGKYDIKVSAYSDSEKLSPDVIIASMGARYKSYCGNMSRTYMVDAPSKVEKTYGTLLSLHAYCLDQMVPGRDIKDVMIKARQWVESNDASLSACLPKSLGFAMGLEFRDSTLVLNDKNTLKFAEGMIFSLVVGFHNVALTDEDKNSSTSAYKKLSAFSVLLGDTVKIVADGPADVLTKLSKEFADVSYNISGQEEEEESEAEDAEGGVRRSKRAKEEKMAMMNASLARAERQKELMRKKVEAQQKKLAAADDDVMEEEEAEEEWQDLNVYRTPAEYPRDIVSTKLKVDLDKEALIVPINGQPVAFHVSTIKSITMPDPDKATYLRINFYTSAGSLAKETPKNMVGLIGNYGDRAVFIKELTFRSLSSNNMAHVHQQYQELRKRVRQRELKADQEKDLVKQDKLIRIKDQRPPRLQDLTMRPTISGKKCIGTLEAHQNGIRFTSVRQEVLDILYDNIKHAIYQPCDVKTSMVVVHFNLKDFIMIGKKKHNDVTFYTEVVDTSVSLDASKRSSYDPDELDEEQREREMRRRLNLAFKDFCMKLEKVASHFNYPLNIDVPFMKSAFEGNPHREMVRIVPTTHCLVNLTETPVFCVTINDIEHVHFERAGFTTKAFDVILIFKDWEKLPKAIGGIETKYMEVIQEWLNLVEITYTVSPNSLAWGDVMQAIQADDRFWLDTEADGTKKPAGWSFLDMTEPDGDEEEEEEEESSYDEASDDEEESESESGSDESDFDASESESDGSEDEEEEAESWEDMEKKAAAADRAKAAMERSEPANGPPQKKSRR